MDLLNGSASPGKAHQAKGRDWESVMNIGYFLFLDFFSLYLLSKETQRNAYLNPYSEFILIFLDIIYSQMTPFHEQSFLLELEPLSFPTMPY